MIKLLFNPFEKYSDKKLLIFGIIATGLGVFLGFAFNSVYDGVLDMHAVINVSLEEAVCFLIIDLLTIGIVLFVLGKYINSKTRFIDVLSTILISKIPIYLLTIINVNGFAHKIGLEIQISFLKNKINDFSGIFIFELILIAILSLLILVWTLILLYNGFKTATNLRSNKHIVLFVISIITAEIISKILISKLL